MTKTMTGVVLFLLLGLGAIPAPAQEPEYRQKREREDVHLRNDCRVAVQVLTRGQPANKREWPLDTINLCDESGPPVLARLWRESGADSASVGHMIYRSVGMRDRRVYDVVSAIARDPAVPGLKRAAALHLLGRWAAPGFALESGAFFAPGYEPPEWYGGRSAIDYTYITHDTQYEGAEPLHLAPCSILSTSLRTGPDAPRNRRVHRVGEGLREPVRDSPDALRGGTRSGEASHRDHRATENFLLCGSVSLCEAIC